MPTATVHPENADLMSLFGIFKPRVKGVTLEDMEEAIRVGATFEKGLLKEPGFVVVEIELSFQSRRTPSPQEESQLMPL